ncbi:MAG: hypothetical protein H6953_12365 [Chromatiaceae bacterium]|nr:hypothetical protein [Chromatiaceae bacterium]MCP5315857.1 hypothetical protein [Chromatiaceae bacterium]
MTDQSAAIQQAKETLRRAKALSQQADEALSQGQQVWKAAGLETAPATDPWDAPGVPGIIRDTINSDHQAFLQERSDKKRKTMAANAGSKSKHHKPRSMV